MPTQCSEMIISFSPGRRLGWGNVFDNGVDAIESVGLLRDFPLTRAHNGHPSPRGDGVLRWTLGGCNKKRLLLKHLIRPVDEERDFPELAAMLDQVMTDGMTVARLRAGAKSPAPLNRKMVVKNDEGAIIGWSMLRRSENEPESRAFTSIIAHPDSRRNGIGSALLEDVVAHARSIGVTALKSRVKDSEPGWLVWAKSKGFEIDRHQFRSSIALSEFDDSSFVGHIAELEAAGIVFTTLAELGDTDENRRRYYDADITAAHDIPGEDYFESWPEYKAEVFGNEEFRPEGAFLALDGDQMIGVAHVMLDSEHDRMENFFTGVLREHRGRGIAQALKVLTIKYAKQRGVSEILTENDSENAPILAVNRKLGYKPWPGAYVLKTTLSQ